MSEELADTDVDKQDDIKLEDLLNDFIGSFLGNFYTMLPGKVISYDAKTQRAAVKPIGGKLEVLPDTGERVMRRYATIQEVVICYPTSSVGGLTFPLAKGDPVMLHFASAALDNWAGGSEVPPPSQRRNRMRDAVATPGLASSPLWPVFDGAVVLHGADIRAGGGDVPPKSRVARQLDLEVLMQAIVDSPDGLGFATSLKSLLAAAAWPNCQSKLRTK